MGHAYYYFRPDMDLLLMTILIYTVVVNSRPYGSRDIIARIIFSVVGRPVGINVMKKTAFKCVCAFQEKNEKSNNRSLDFALTDEQKQTLVCTCAEKKRKIKKSYS